MGEGALRALKVAVVVMGVLIVGGTALLGVVIARRMSGAQHATASTPPLPTVTTPAAATPSSAATLDEPPGTRVAATTLAGDRLALTLTGGGPDRVVILDLRDGRVVARVGLRSSP